MRDGHLARLKRVLEVVMTPARTDEAPSVRFKLADDITRIFCPPNAPCPQKLHGRFYNATWANALPGLRVMQSGRDRLSASSFREIPYDLLALQRPLYLNSGAAFSSALVASVVACHF
jgi:hypothetical protein